MAALRTILALLSLGARAHSQTVETHYYNETIRANKVLLSLEPVLSGGFHIVLIEGASQIILGHIGRTLTSPYIVEDVDGGVEVSLGSTNLTIRTVADEETNAKAIKIRWHAEPTIRLEDCIDFGNCSASPICSYVVLQQTPSLVDSQFHNTVTVIPWFQGTKHWYAGPMQEHQVLPLQDAEQTYSASYNKESDNGAIMERYWLNSAGQYIFVHSEVPLFVDYKNILSNHICFGAQLAEPYSLKRNKVILAYDFWILEDVKSAHMHAVENYLGKPSDTPDYRMVRHPVWSTWGQYSQDITGSKLKSYAQEIIEAGFKNSQIEIDAQWEACYGSLEINNDKFPLFNETIKELKEMGYRVTIWVHPFIYKNCEPWYTTALANRYFVCSEEDITNTNWLNNNGTTAGYIDFTNTWAADWWVQRVNFLLETYEIDSIKVDAGEASYAPEIAELTGDIEMQPHLLVQAFANACTIFGKMVSVRSAFRNQNLPIFIRMIDRDSVWDLNNGLATLITTTFQMNLNGYPFVLPSFIGGSGYNLGHGQIELPSKELYIRWVQACTFLPVMQFSFAPWNYDEETVAITKRYVELHTEYADVIFEAMETAVSIGTPVNKPIWWLSPTDKIALGIWDEYLLGDTILVAPVLTEDTVFRNIYLPPGTWYEEGDRDRVIKGPIWLPYYPAPLDTLPFFVRETSIHQNSEASVIGSLILVLSSIIATSFY